MAKCCAEAGSYITTIVPCFLGCGRKIGRESRKVGMAWGGGLGSDRSTLAKQEDTGAAPASRTTLRYGS